MTDGSTRHGGILTLDLATTSGWAYGHASARLTRPAAFGAWNLGKGTSPARWAALADQLGEHMSLLQPSLVVFEAPLPPQAQTQANIARLLWGLCTVAELICHRRSIECREQSAVQPRKTLIGKARPDKDEIVHWCRGRGLEITDHNAADAVVLWYFAAALRS